MAVLDTINVGGADFSLMDKTARETASTAKQQADATLTSLQYRTLDPGAYFGTGAQADANNKFTVALPTNYPFQWNSWNSSTLRAGIDPEWLPKGGMMRTTKAVKVGDTITPGINCEKFTISQHLDLIRTYVGSDDKLHYRDWLGADSVLNFSGGLTNLEKIAQMDTTIDRPDLYAVSDKTMTASGNYSGLVIFVITCPSIEYENQQVSISSQSGLSNFKSNIWTPQMGIASGIASGSFSLSVGFANSKNKPCGIYVFK